MDTTKSFNVLFLCTGNSARSIMAEALLNNLGRGRFHAYSAGSHPAGHINAYALRLLTKNHLPIDGLRSKDWSEFAQEGAPHMDFVFTVCDNAAGELYPVWPGQPMTAHWGVADPAAVEGSDEDKEKASWQAFNQLQRRLSLLVSLPIDKLDRIRLQEAVREIGAT